ncbi:tRNA (adenine(37)-N6)-methyltransferase-like [Hylaeus volcanicus]|uniref:tRNA (adenine(37)-N6)-methyltransferase-like n=1 Tax=Hylaeus volcanicus TaxID=313075 RepID=UPI0023B85661|nr:tRNA (adenine(37)-N6)-methyltransferase-like [Hylaeus volcanicus]
MFPNLFCINYKHEFNISMFPLSSIKFVASKSKFYGLLTSTFPLEYSFRENKGSREFNIAKAQELTESILTNVRKESINHTCALPRECEWCSNIEVFNDNKLKMESLRSGHLNVVFTNFKKSSKTGFNTHEKLKPEEFPQAFERSSKNSLTAKYIGIVRSCFRTKYGVPRQGLLVSKAKGVIEFTTDIDHSFLEGLDEFSHCWLIWVFHIGHSESIKGKVRLPKLQGNRKGVFATRSPHRPSPIGLSLVKIDRVLCNEVMISGLDLVDGTPILDIKPYHPFDHISPAVFPTWIPDAEARVKVKFAEGVLDKLHELIQWTQSGRKGEKISKQGGISPFQFFSSCDDFLQTVTDLLGQDPRTPQQCRSDAEKTNICFVDNFEISYVIDGLSKVATVNKIRFDRKNNLKKDANY